MNKIAVQTGGPEERLGIDETYRMVKEWGFDAVDANIDHLLSGRSIVEGNIPQAHGGSEAASWEGESHYECETLHAGRKNGTFPAERISSARSSIIASAGSGAPNGSSRSPESNTDASSTRSRSWSGEYVSIPNDSERTAAGPNLVPGRKLVVESKGAPNKTTFASSKSFSAPMKFMPELYHRVARGGKVT